MSFWESLDPKYRLILCDVWGVIHNGVELYPGVAHRLMQWRDAGRCVVLLTNAPRTAEAVEQQLGEIGLSPHCFDAIVTSGEAGIEALKELGKPVGFIGTPGDRSVLEGRGISFANDKNFSDLACTGIEEGRSNPDDYRSHLEELADRDVQMHCLNPDRLVVRGGVPEPCAGAIADIYQMLGGRVVWYGKPFATIYEHVVRKFGNVATDQILAIGDGLQTDILGAARMGFDTVFISGGIHAGEPFPDDFAARNGLGRWRPVAVVNGLA